MNPLDLNRFIDGAISGCFGVLISHPFDTLKTRLQTMNANIYKLQGLYRGISAPLLGVGLEKAIVFGTYTNLRNTREDGLFNTAICGALAGLTASMIVTPCERLKIQMQNGAKLDTKMLNPMYFYRGLSATFTREIPGFSIYFTTFEYLQRYFNCDHRYLYTFFHGGLAGVVSWSLIYPQDCIKTLMQSTDHDRNWTETARNIYRQGGLVGFYRGFPLALMRAIPLHAGTFLMMDILNKKDSNFSK